MKKNILKQGTRLLAAASIIGALLTGCGPSGTGANAGVSTSVGAGPSESAPAASAPPAADSAALVGDASAASAAGADATAPSGAPVTQLYVTFGDSGTPFALQLYDNETAAAIARHVGSADWRLPIYNYEGYDNWEVMQYYDIPSRYEIPSSPESVTSEASGTVYYSEPNRIVLFYGDAQISADYTPVGYFASTDAFVSAVRDNPVLEGWGNKIIRISVNG